MAEVALTPTSFTPDDPCSVRDRAKALKRVIDTAYIQLGRELYQIFHRRLFIEWGFDTFDDYLERDIGISRSRGDRVRRIWTKFVKELNLKIDQLEGVGYTNALALLSVINTENADVWLKKAKTLSWRDLTLEIAVVKGPSPETVEALGGARVVEEDDEDLSGEGGFDEVPGGGGGVLPSERSGLTADGPSPDRRRPPKDEHDPDGAHARARVEVLEAKRTQITLKLKHDQLLVWQAAVDEVNRSKKTETSIGECVAHIATEFLANRMTKEKQPASRVEFYLSTFGRVFGGKFIWVKNDEAAEVLTAAIDAHPHLFTVPTTTKEEVIVHDHPDDASDDADDGNDDELADGDDPA